VPRQTKGHQHSGKGGIEQKQPMPSSATPDAGRPEAKAAAPGFHGWQVPHSVAVVLAILAAALLFLLLGPYSNFGATGYLDPWLYTGYFTHFSYLLRHGGVTYYVSRLPWIVPGWFVFKIAQPAAATILLNALIVAVSASSLYFIVYWRYGKWPAVLACIALATNPYFMFAVAWDYPDGPAIAYAFLGTACFMRPKQGRLPNAVLGGFCAALSGFTNMAGAPVLLAMLTIPIWRYRRSLWLLAKEVAYIICGVLAATLILAPLGKALLNSFLFFMPQVRQILYVSSHPEYLANMWGTGNAWIPKAIRLAPVLFLTLVGPVVLMKRKRSDALVPAYLFLLATSVLFAVGEFVFHNVGLRVASCSAYIIAPLLAFAGHLFGELWQPVGRSGPGWKGLAPALPWAAAALFGVGLPFWYSAVKPSFETSQVWMATVVITIAACACCVAPLPWRPLLAAVSCCLLLAGLFLGPACDPGIAYPWAKVNAGTFRSLMAIETLVDSGVTEERPVRFWYDRDEPLPAQNLYDSAFSLYLWGYVDLSDKLPSASAAEILEWVKPNATLVHLTLDPAKVSKRNEILASRALVVGNERHWSLPSPVGTIHVVLQDVIDRSGVH